MIHCSPVMNGPHQVHQSYLSILATICTIDGLKGPCRVAVNGNGHIFVVENSGHCISVLDREGKKVKSFTSTKFSHPHAWCRYYTG